MNYLPGIQDSITHSIKEIYKKKSIFKHSTLVICVAPQNALLAKATLQGCLSAMLIGTSGGRVKISDICEVNEETIDSDLKDLAQRLIVFTAMSLSIEITEKKPSPEGWKNMMLVMQPRLSPSYLIWDPTDVSAASKEEAHS